MSHRYDPDYPSDTGLRREERWGSRREEEEEYPLDYRARRYGEGYHRPSRERDVGTYGSAYGSSHGAPYGERRYWGQDLEEEYYAAMSGHRRPSRGAHSPSLGRYAERGFGAPYVGERFPPPRGAYEEQVWASDARPPYGYSPGYPTGYAGYPGAGYPGSRGADPYLGVERWRSENEARRAGAGYGGHYGKGPKGYVRSDERIREDVSDRLSDDDEVDASDVTVTVVQGEVRLEGTVPDRYSKHRAEDVAESVSGVREVSNHLRTRKGFLQEVGDKLTGDDKHEHRGHAGSGTQNSPPRGGGLSAQR